MLNKANVFFSAIFVIATSTAALAMTDARNINNSSVDPLTSNLGYGVAAQRSANYTVSYGRTNAWEMRAVTPSKVAIDQQYLGYGVQRN